MIIMKVKYKKDKKPNWVHYSFGGWVPSLKRNSNGETTLCGKTARRIRVTKIKDEVTCPRCKELLIADNWYCSNCDKFLKAEEVTFDETCIHCGRKLSFLP